MDSASAKDLFNLKLGAFKNADRRLATALTRRDESSAQLMVALVAKGQAERDMEAPIPLDQPMERLTSEVHARSERLTQASSRFVAVERIVDICCREVGEAKIAVCAAEREASLAQAAWFGSLVKPEMDALASRIVADLYRLHAMNLQALRHGASVVPHSMPVVDDFDNFLTSEFVPMLVEREPKGESHIALTGKNIPPVESIRSDLVSTGERSEVLGASGPQLAQVAKRIGSLPAADSSSDGDASSSAINQTRQRHNELSLKIVDLENKLRELRHAHGKTPVLNEISGLKGTPLDNTKAIAAAEEKLKETSVELARVSERLESMHRAREQRAA